MSRMSGPKQKNQLPSQLVSECQGVKIITIGPKQPMVQLIGYQGVAIFFAEHYALRK